MVKYLTLKLSDELYEELERRAREEGFALVSDYVRELIARSIKRTPKRLEGEDIESIVSEMVEEKVKEVLNEVLPEILQNVEFGEANLKDILDEAISKLERKFERKLDDMLNPWTQKVDEIARRVAELQEKVEELEETVNELKKKEERIEERVERAEREEEHRFERAERAERREKRGGKLVQIFKERKVYFEGKDLSWAKNKERIIDILVKHGAIKIDTEKWGRILVHPEAWEEFKEALSMAKSGSDEEVYALLKDEKLRELFDALRKEGILYFDSSTKTWRLLEEGEEKTL